MTSNMINVYIPISSEQLPFIEVYNSLSEQTLKINSIHTVVYPGVSGRNSSYVGSTIDKYLSESSCRNKILQIAKEFNNEYFIMQDSDILHYYQNNFSLMLDFLQSNKDVGVVALRKNRGKSSLFESHILNACVMVRSSIIDYIQFSGLTNSCTCKNMTLSLQKEGIPIVYLDSIIRIRELNLPVKVLNN